ncbi:MAG: peptidoglycan DD-metalloendopeptidase family protein [Elusimicrobia bacterium]|nr:peptidoglycan DD-metalloendopeptidase family protein [Elusimicrobiota bacterium]
MIRPAPLLVSALLVCSTLLAAPPVQKELKFKSRDLDKIREEMSRKKEEKERLKKEAETLSSSVKGDEAQIKNVEQSLLNTHRREIDVEQQVAATKNRQDGLLVKLDDERSALRNSAERTYLAMLLDGPNGIAPVYGKQVIRLRADQVAEVDDQAQKEHKSLESLVDTQTVLRGVAKKQQAKLSDIKTAHREKEKKLSKTTARQEAVDGELRDLQQSAEQLASLIEGLRSRAKKEAEDERRQRLEKQLAGKAPILLHSLPWPLKGTVTTKFGRQQTGTAGGATIISNGIVIKTPEDRSVTAVADGKVLYAGDFMGYGPMAVVEHAGDWYSVYAHLAGWNVEKGQNVKRGETIGQPRTRTGGGANEAYFELRFYGKPADPVPFLALP